jgi:putative transcriptional regulator
LRNKIKYLRRSENFDLTQDQLAKELGVSRQTIVAIESGANTSAELVMKISAFFDKDPREIFFVDFVVSNLQTDEKVEAG